MSALHIRLWRVLVLTLGCVWTPAAVLGNEAVTHFKNDIQPILAEYCYDCHGDGMNKGGIAFDELKTDEAVLNHDLWLKVLKKSGRTPEEVMQEMTSALDEWIQGILGGVT